MIWIFFDRIIRLMAGLSAIFILFIMLSICGEVFMRYLFKRPLMWTVEISEYLQLYVAFLAAAWVLRRDGHVKLEIFTGMLGMRAQKAFFYISNALGFATVSVIMCFSGIVTYEQFVLQTPVIKSLEMPKWIVLIPIPAGCLFLSLEFIRKMYVGFGKS